MHDTNKFYLSNSMLTDWNSMCPVEWKERWIDKNPAYELDSIAIQLGNAFEQNVIGMSVGGKVTEPSPELKKNASYPRMLEQAKRCRRYLKDLGGKIIGRQTYLFSEVQDVNGNTIYICGNLDILYEMPDGHRIIIDLKFTGDTENTWGDFAWGKPESMNLSQSIQYSLLHKCVYPQLPTPEFIYSVWDHKPAMRFLPLRVKISDQAFDDHIENLSMAYFEITDSMMFDTWTPTPSFDKCSQCKVPCKYQVKYPEVKEIYI